MLGSEHPHSSACCVHLHIHSVHVVRLLISVEAYTKEATPQSSCLLILRWEWESVSLSLGYCRTHLGTQSQLLLHRG